MEEGKPQGARASLVHAMVFCGGIAALSWEVVWQLEASLAFGVSAVGTALTLAIAMAGMAVGSLLAGRRLSVRPPDQPLRVYGALELVIGISGLLLVPGFALLELLDAQIYALAPALATPLQAVAMALLMAPPTLAMGATIPVFQLLARQHGTRVSVLYGLNTAGAALGVLLLTFVILPAVGVALACVVVAAVNALIFAATQLTGDTPAKATAPADAGDADSPTHSTGFSPRLAGLIVFITGFSTFALEVAWFRALRSAFWSTSATFAMLLAAVLIPLAIGARLVPTLRRRGVAPGALLAGAGAAVLLATPVIERLDLLVFVEGSHFYVLGFWFLLCLATMGPAVVLLATLLPWCLEDLNDPETTGRLYGMNTLGSVVGSLGAAWILLPSLGFARSAWLLSIPLLGIGVAILRPRGRIIATVVGCLALGVAITQTSSPGRDRMFRQFDFSGAKVLAFREGPDFNTSVVLKRNGIRALFIDGFGASNENEVGGLYMEWMGTLPALLHPKPEEALVICFGTGRTTNAVRREGVDHVDVVDVSAGVFSLSQFFPINESVLDAPNVDSHVMDGRAWLRRETKQYDLITLEPMPPNFSGVNALYSREFYEIVASRLAPGGIAVQWLPFHLVSVAHSRAVAASFLDVFADAALWVEPYGGTGILVGRLAASGDPLGSEWPGLRRRRVERVLSDDEIRNALVFDAKDLARYVEGSDLVTDDNQLLAWGQMRPGRQGKDAQRLARRNWKRVEELAGHPILNSDRETVRRRAALLGASGPRPLSKARRSP